LPVYPKNGKKSFLTEIINCKIIITIIRFKKQIGTKKCGGWFS